MPKVPYRIIAILLTLLIFGQTALAQDNAGRPLFSQDDLRVLVGNVQRPNGIVYLNGNLYTVCNGDWTIYEIQTESELTVTYIFGVRNAHSVYAEETDAGFNLWIPDFDTNSLVRVDQNRSAPDVISEEGLDGPWGITDLDDETFLITNLRANTISTMTRDGEANEIMSGLRSPSGIAGDEAHIYIANNGSARRAIEWIDRDDLGNSSELKPLVSGLQNTGGLVMAADGYLYFTFAQGTRGLVGRVDPEQCRESGCSNSEIEIVVNTELPAPLAGLTLSDDMRLFVHTIYRPEIYWVDLEDTQIE